jgi:thioesterase domain-containing protein
MGGIDILTIGVPEEAATRTSASDAPSIPCDPEDCSKTLHLSPPSSESGQMPPPAPAPGLDVWSAAGKLVALQSQALPISCAGPDGRRPLSFAQERLWGLEFAEPGVPYQHIPLAWEITGEVDPEVLEQSLDYLVQRHEALRTVFPADASGPFQQVRDWHLRLKTVDLSSAAAGDGKGQALAAANQFVREPFDLSTGPLLRAALYRWNPREALLVWVVHQMNFDGGSMRIIGRELGACYQAIAAGTIPALPPLPVQYVHFARWQKETLKGQLLTETGEHWRRQFQKGYRSLPLAADVQRKDSSISPGGHLAVFIPKALRDGLRRLSVAEGVTFFSALLASFDALLSRCTGREDILTLASVASRTQPELRHLVGMVSNVLPLRLDLSGSPSFRQLLRRAGTVVSSAFAHQMLPLNRILEMLTTPDSSNRNPLLQVGFVYSGTPVPILRLDGVTFTPSDAIDNGVSKLDLQLELADAPDGITGHIKYRSDLFAPENIERFLRQWQCLLEQILACPDVPFASLALPPDAPVFTTEANGTPVRPDQKSPQTAVAKGGSEGPQDTLEETLKGIWEQAFGIRPIGLQDNFFGLGGHSLLGIRIVTAIEQALGRRVRLSTIFQEPTIARLGAVLRGGPAARGSSIVEIQPGGKQPPLFLVHGVGGGMFWGYSNLARHLGPDQPVYGFKSRGQDGLEEFSRIEDMAAQYVEDLRRFQPNGPYFLGGYCFGGNVAFEMARQLDNQGEQVAMLLLINCWPNNSTYTRLIWTPLVLPKAFWNFCVRLQHQVRFGAKRPRAYFKWRAAWLWKWLKAVFTRRFEDRVAVEDMVDPSQQTEAERQLWRTHVRAWLQYQPQSYPGRIVLFRTRGHPLVSSFDDQLGWAEFASGGVDVHVCPGDHESILAEENVACTARQLQTLLAKLHSQKMAPPSEPTNGRAQLSVAGQSPAQDVLVTSPH